MKTAKKIFKIVGIILGIIILALIGYIIYLFASYHRIEDNLPLEVESHAADAELDRKSTRLNSSHPTTSRMPSSA